MGESCELSLAERLIIVQKQLRIAIQNHQLMVLRKPLLSKRDDEKIRYHMEALQYIILNIGKTQANLLNEYKNEIATKHSLQANDPAIIKIMKKNLQFPDPPKFVPITKSFKSEHEKRTPIAKQKMKSVLKVNSAKDTKDSDTNNIGFTKLHEVSEGSNIKIIYGKKKESNSILVPHAKKLQSVLKPKITQIKKEKVSEEDVAKSKNFLSKIKIERGIEEENKNFKNVQVKKEKDEYTSQSPPLQSALPKTRSKDKKSPSPDLPSEDMDSPQASSPKMDTRYGRKYEAKLLSNKAKSATAAVTADPASTSKKNTENEWNQEEWMPFPSASTSSSQSSDKLKIDDNPLSIDELSQETYLGMFRLVSKSKCEMLKKKKCERKRRSVAGQNSQYSDYLQPMPKRTYQPRKSLPAAPSLPTSSNAVIVESSTGDDDDYEDKEKCCICHEGGESMETCYGCNVSFHSNCLPTNQKDICPSPNCMAQRTISNIVGANVSSGNASDLELVKRYLSDELVSEKQSDEKAGPSKSTK